MEDFALSKKRVHRTQCSEPRLHTQQLNVATKVQKGSMSQKKTGDKQLHIWQCMLHWHVLIHYKRCKCSKGGVMERIQHVLTLSTSLFHAHVPTQGQCSDLLYSVYIDCTPQITKFFLLNSCGRKFPHTTCLINKYL